MKKLLIVLGLLGIFQIGSTLYYESKLLDEPLIIAGAVDLNNQRVHVSYITNRINPVELQSIAIEGVQYSANPDEFSFFINDEKVIETFADYTYYSIISPDFPLDTYQLEDIRKQLSRTTEATVSFKGGHTAQITLDVQEYQEIPQLELVSSVGNSQGSKQEFKVVEPMTIEVVELVKGDVTIANVSLNGKQLELPLQEPIELAVNDQLHITVTDHFARFAGDKYLIHLNVRDLGGEALIVPLSNNVNGNPSEQWVEQLVKEREQR